MFGNKREIEKLENRIYALADRCARLEGLSVETITCADCGCLVVRFYSYRGEAEIRQGPVFTEQNNYIHYPKYCRGCYSKREESKKTNKILQED